MNTTPTVIVCSAHRKRCAYRDCHSTPYLVCPTPNFLQCSGEIDHIHVSFMVAGHTNFAPDHLLSTVGSTYNREDTFTIHELKSICDQCATTCIVDGEQVYTWRDTLGVRYSDLPGVRKYDFLVVKTHDGRVVMKV